MQSVASISLKEVRDYHAKSNWIVDGRNSDYYWNIDFGRPRPVEMDLGDWFHRSWFTGDHEKVTLAI
jgi:hypothetical protein